MGEYTAYESAVRMMRFICAFLLVVAAVLPASAAQTVPVKAEIRSSVLIISWKPPAGQLSACAEQVGGLTLDCIYSSAGQIRIGPGSLWEWQRLEAGDRVRVKIYGAGGVELGRGESQVFGRTRYLPMVLHGKVR